MRFLLTTLILTAGAAWGFIAPIKRPILHATESVLGHAKASIVLALPFLIYAFYDRRGFLGEASYYIFIVICGYLAYILVYSQRLDEAPDDVVPETFEDTKPNLDARIDAILNDRANR